MSQDTDLQSNGPSNEHELSDEFDVDPVRSTPESEAVLRHSSASELLVSFH